MSEFFNQLCAAFRAQGWEYREVSEHEVIESQFEAHHTRVPIHLQAFPAIGAVHVVATSAHPFEHWHLLKLCELLMRVSQQLTLGNFEMNWEKRQVMFRVTNLFDPDRKISPPLLGAMVHAAVAEMDRMTPLLAAISASPQTSVGSINIPHLLQREDGRPPVPVEEEV